MGSDGDGTLVGDFFNEIGVSLLGHAGGFFF